MKWLIQNPTVPSSLSELKRVLLTNRHISTENEWFKPAKPTTIKISDLEISEQNLTVALTLLSSIKATDGLVVIFGDYDADGITATAVLWRVLHNLGFNAKPFIPDRLRHGYGLTVQALKEIFNETRPQLIVTVDNGIVAHEAVEFLNQEKCPIIITDHHLPEESLPKAQAIVHSTKLCGAGVAWIFGREIIRHFAPDNDQLISHQLDLVGIATIADQMPLTEFNRAFATWGIKALKVSTRLGLIQLIKTADIQQNSIDSGLINYTLAPRINAMGRLKQGLEALRLLCTNKLDQATALAAELTATNFQRQDLTAEQVEEALAQLDSQLDQNLFVVQSPNFHEGVIGLIAGKITEQFHKPVIVLALNQTTAKASARSIAGVNIIELIRTVKADLLAAGGHPMAAGFGIEVKKIATIKKKLQTAALKLPQELFEKQLPIDCLLPTTLIDEKTFHLVKTFEPFGMQNPTPVFGFTNFEIVSAKTIGQTQNHLRLAVKTADNKFVTVIGWKMGDLHRQLLAGGLVKIAGVLSLNEWRGRSTIQIVAKSIEAIEA